MSSPIWAERTPQEIADVADYVMSLHK